MQMIVEAFPPELRIALEVTLEGEETMTCHSCWEEGGGKYRKREMRNELRCFMEPSKAIFCFKKILILKNRREPSTPTLPSK